MTTLVAAPIAPVVTAPPPAAAAPAPVVQTSAAPVVPAVVPAVVAPVAPVVPAVEPVLKASDSAAAPTPEQIAADKVKADALAAAPLELKYPDGFKGDPAALEAFKPIAKELGLDAPKAQKLVEFFAKTEQARVAAAEKQGADWVAQVKADPTMGGEKLKATAAAAHNGAKWAGGEKLVALLEETGLGNHPEVVRAFSKIGLAIKDDSVAGGGTKPAELNAEEKLLRGLFNHPTSQQMFTSGR